jgi:hypothetical protein
MSDAEDERGRGDGHRLGEEARERLADVVELQPTKNADLQERWGMDSGSEVHGYLESELKAYYYRNEQSLICATPEAVELVGGDATGMSVTVTPFQAAVLDVLAGPDERAESVVSVLHKLREEGREPEDGADAVRSALRRLADRGLVEVVERTVPTFKLALARADLDVAVEDPDGA